jgi:MOSC domain-containing protein YiiM
MQGKVVAVSISELKGVPKENVSSRLLVKDMGLEGDAHAGFAHRQISLLGMDSIDKMRAGGAKVKPGDFAENLTIEGLVLYEIPVGTELRIGDSRLRVSQIGKECHHGCAIRQTVGDCVMPREGIFAVVEQGGIVKVGDTVEVMVNV